MKSKEEILYNNYHDNEIDAITREFIFDQYASERGWTTESDIPDDLVYERIEYDNYEYWCYIEEELTKLFNSATFLITGTCGRWNGPCDCGRFIQSLDDFKQFIAHLDSFKIIDRNGHLIVEGSHHDGNDTYELKRLTNKGYELANSNYFAQDKKLHSTIMKTNFYSALPRLAEQIYGVNNA